MLVIGQGDTLDRLETAMPRLPAPEDDAPPQGPQAAARCTRRSSGSGTSRTARPSPSTGSAAGSKPPTPKVISCVTGSASYDALNARDTLIRWVDQPQLLWDAISETLVGDVDLVIHVGPAPNLIPATFERLSNNVTKQLGNRYLQMIGRGVGSSINRHAWLARLLPSRASLLRAPHVRHVILEDWLLEQPLDPVTYTSVYNRDARGSRPCEQAPSGRL